MSIIAQRKRRKRTRESPGEAMLVYFHRAIRVINYSFITRRRFADILSSYRSALRKTNIKVRGSGSCALSGMQLCFKSFIASIIIGAIRLLKQKRLLNKAKLERDDRNRDSLWLEFLFFSFRCFSPAFLFIRQAVSRAIRPTGNVILA